MATQACTRTSANSIHLRNPFTDLGQEEVSSLATIQSQFQKDGFYSFHNIISNDAVHELNHRLEHVLRGNYDRGVRPDKTPKLVKASLPSRQEESTMPIGNEDTSSSTCTSCISTKEEDDNGRNGSNRSKGSNSNNGFGVLGFTGNRQNVKVMQIINIHKSDSYFHELVTNPVLGEIVSKLMGWKDGARLAQDQVWAKPPNAPPLAYHRDSPYFMFEPHAVATVWIALDDMTSELGPLSYVKGSHLWGEGRVGSSQNFFQSDGGMALLYSAAERANVPRESLEYVSMAGMKAGGLSIHDGRTWHGSGSNLSKAKPRRGIGLHFIPRNVHWTEDARKSRLWGKYVDDFDGDLIDMPVDDVDFPITWQPS